VTGSTRFLVEDIHNHSVHVHSYSLNSVQNSLLLTGLHVRHTEVFFVCNGPPVSQGLLIHEVSITHNDAPQSVGLLWTGKQPDAETST